MIAPLLAYLVCYSFKVYAPGPGLMLPSLTLDLTPNENPFAPAELDLVINDDLTL